MSRTLNPHRPNAGKEVAKQDSFIAAGRSLNDSLRRHKRLLPDVLKPPVAETK